MASNDTEKNATRGTLKLATDDHRSTRIRRHRTTDHGQLELHPWEGRGTTAKRPATVGVLKGYAVSRHAVPLVRRVHAIDRALRAGRWPTDMSIAKEPEVHPRTCAGADTTFQWCYARSVCVAQGSLVAGPTVGPDRRSSRWQTGRILSPVRRWVSEILSIILTEHAYRLS